MEKPPITQPPTEVDDKGKLILESIKVKTINFNKNFHPEFKGYLSEQYDGVWVSMIESKEIGKGNFSKLIKELKKRYNWIKIPTLSNMMRDIAIHLGFNLKEEYFGSPFNYMGEIMLWKKEAKNK